MKNEKVLTFDILVLSISLTLKWAPYVTGPKFNKRPRRLLRNTVCNEISALQTYLNEFLKALDKYAPKKSKYVRENNSSFMNKKISKAVKDCTRPKNKFLKTDLLKSWFAYNEQVRKYLIRKTKLE